jgi:hypothetical protein
MRTDPIGKFLEAHSQARAISEELRCVQFFMSYNRRTMKDRYGAHTARKVNKALVARNFELIEAEREAWFAVAKTAQGVVEDLARMVRDAQRDTRALWVDLLRAMTRKDAVAEESAAFLSMAYATSAGARSIARMEELLELMSQCPSKRDPHSPTWQDRVRTRNVHFLQRWASQFRQDLRDFAELLAENVEVQRLAKNGAEKARKILRGGAEG